jgi:hypothetical protein
MATLNQSAWLKGKEHGYTAIELPSVATPDVVVGGEVPRGYQNVDGINSGPTSAASSGKPSSGGGTLLDDDGAAAKSRMNLGGQAVALLALLMSLGALLSAFRNADTAGNAMMEQGTVPLQPASYHTVIELHMPYLDLVEPFEVS